MSSKKGENNNSINNEWIEIIEPKSKVQMFANLITGECRWDEPKDSIISRASNPLLTQWWELFDTQSQRFYYYCAKDSKTVWKRPQTTNSIVVPLAKLQILKQNTTNQSNQLQSSQSSTQSSTQSKCHVSTQTTTQTQLISRSTQTQTSNDNNCLSFRGNPSLKHYLISERREAKGNQIYDKYDSNDDDFDDEEEEDDDEESDLSCDADDEYDCDEYNIYDDELSEDNDEDDDYSDEHQIRRPHIQYNNNNNRFQLELRQQKPSIMTTTVITSPTTTTTQSTSQSLIPTKSHSLTQISNNNNLIKNNNKRMTTTATTTQTLQLIRPQTPPNRQMSHMLSLIPTQSSSSLQTTNKTKEQKIELELFAKENIERHRKRGLFLGRKISLKSMLEWSKKSIKKPMISSINDQKLIKDSKQMFKFVQKFMKDLENNSENNENNGHENDEKDIEICFYLLNICSQKPLLRDELLVQISRQTTNNPSIDSELRGLQLMCSCFWYFPPSQKLAPHLNAFLTNHSNVFAREIVKRKFEQQLRRSQQSHVVYVRKPHDLEEVSRVLRCVRMGFVGVFGEELSDAVIGGQNKRIIPWPIVCLTESLLKLRSNEESCDREGVFRCVGDLDEVNQLKMRIDTIIINQTNGQMNDDINNVQIKDDIHVIASGLKLYFRELKEPLIPYNLYFEALECAHSPQLANQLIEDKLPKINRLSLSYLIRFLQVFSAPEHVKSTKMDDANLSMVWAPNILRNPINSCNSIIASNSFNSFNSFTNTTNSTNSTCNIFEQTRSEMSFVRTLIQNFDTSFMSGIQ